MFIFTWHPAKAAANLQKHRISFQEAVTVFRDPLSITLADDEHSWGERRWVTFGLSRRRRLIAVFHWDDPDGTTIRLISARPCTRAECKSYEES